MIQTSEIMISHSLVHDIMLILLSLWKWRKISNNFESLGKQKNFGVP